MEAGPTPSRVVGFFGAMSKPSPQRPALMPVTVPWRIGRSSHLRIKLLEGFIASPVLADFVGFFRHVDVNASPSADAGAAPLASFQEAASVATMQCHLVRVVFARGYWARFSSSVSEARAVRDEDYDWSAVPTAMR